MRNLALILGILVVAACSLGGNPAPSRATLNIPDQQRDVPIAQPVSLTFSGPVALATVLRHLSLAPATDGSFELTPNRRTVTFTPQAWDELTVYRVRLAPLKELDGTPVAGASWSFTTVIVPRILSVKDDAGKDLAATLEVERGSKVNLAFNTPMSATDTVVTANGQPAQLSWAADGVSASLPTAGMAVGPLALALTAGKDAAGHEAKPGWQLALDVAYVVHIATRQLPFPALVQIPNDGYGARPQVGIQAASLVFEYQTEGSIQRLTALFMHAPDVVGPTRSGRRISFRLVRHYQGNLFLSGLSDDAHRQLVADPVPAWFDNPPAFYRDLSRAAPNNLMLSGDGILADEQAAGSSGYGGSPDGPYKVGKPELGPSSPATSFVVDEHRSAYTYDPTLGVYTKVEDGQTMTDAAQGKPDQIFMVLVLHTNEFLVPDIESGCCTHGRDFDLDSHGELDIYYRGQASIGTWSSADRAAPLVFVNASGGNLTLPNGLVWVDVVGN